MSVFVVAGSDTRQILDAAEVVFDFAAPSVKAPRTIGFLAGIATAWNDRQSAVEMSGRRLQNNDIVKLAPGEGTDFFAVTDTVRVVVKLPPLVGDKYLA